MNAQRRKKIATLHDDLTVIRDEEQAAYDNLPDNIRESAAGDERQELIDKIEEAIYFVRRKNARHIIRSFGRVRCGSCPPVRVHRAGRRSQRK